MGTTSLAAARAAALFAVACAALTWAPVALADLSGEEMLAQRYAPVVRVVEQREECGSGEPFRPVDVDVLFDEPTVALRGPWNRTDLVKVAPAAADLADLYDFHLDFPGDALQPGCDYERWQRRIADDRSIAVYAHVATDRQHPGALALQYWFFWVFNDFNNLHEGDWEMIQLNFAAPNTQAALGSEPATVGYSSHEGAERADWGDGKLELVDGSHPVVYPAAGSHANKYTQALYIGSSADAGVGCDDTRGPHTEIRPRVVTIPSDPSTARQRFPWIAFDGRWGELQPAFFNGPTGPNLKTQWTAPIEWSQGWRERSYAVPTGGIVGTGATDFFCAAVETGSRVLVSLLRNASGTLLVLAVLLALAWFAASRTTWRPATPLRLGRRRSWGQILSTAGRAYVRRGRLFIGIGLVFIPLGAIIGLLQAVLIGGFGLVGLDSTGTAAGALAILLLTVGTTLTLLGVALVQAAVARALTEIDHERSVGPIRAYRLAVDRLRPLLRGLAIAVLVCVPLVLTGLLVPVAIWLGVRWVLLAQVVELEGCSAAGGLHRSAQLVRGRWLRIASLVGVGTVLALAIGPLLGAILILATNLPLPLLNVVAGVVYALAMPFVALTTCYAYFDARVRNELGAESGPDKLPAEINLERSLT